MLPYYKRQYAVNCSQDYLILVREILQEQLTKLESGKITTFNQKNALSMLILYQGNIDCLIACRIEFKHILPSEEL